MSRRIGILALLGALILVTDARAQGQTGNTVPDERPATTTIMGDTGLWFVPTGEVLKDKQWSEGELQRDAAWQYRHFYGAV